MVLLAGVATRDITKHEAMMPTFNALDSYEVAGTAQSVVGTAEPDSVACPVMAKALVLRSTTSPVETVAIVTLDVVAIDNLPTLVAKEASAEYSKQLAPQLHNLHRTRRHHS